MLFDYPNCFDASMLDFEGIFRHVHAQSSPISFVREVHVQLLVNMRLFYFALIWHINTNTHKHLNEEGGKYFFTAP